MLNETILVFMLHTVSLSQSDAERTIEFEFVRATENAALNSLSWTQSTEFLTWLTSAAKS